MKKSLYICLAAVVAVILCLSGCSGLRDAYISANTTPTPVPLPSSVLGPGAKVEAEFCEDINGDDVYETVTVCSEGGRVVLYVSAAGDISNIKFNSGSYDSSFIAYTKSGKACVFICVRLGEGFVTSVVSFDGIKPRYESGIPNRVTSVSGTDIRAEDDVRVIGSWHCRRDFKLTNSFNLESATDYIITMDEKQPLHVIKELPVEMLIGGVYSEQTLQPGTYIYPESTNILTYLKFKLEDGSSGIINYHKSGSNFFIGGLIHDYEYFDNIEYWD